MCKSLSFCVFELFDLNDDSLGIEMLGHLDSMPQLIGFGSGGL